MARTRGGLHYVTTDLRPPWRKQGLSVIFHHGIGTNHQVWSEWIPIVAARHPATRFDMRGFGQSVVPPEDHSWSLEEMAEDVWQVADAATAGKVHLVGESIGGTFVLAAAIQAPDRVASVTLSNATYKGAGIGELPFWRAQFDAEGVEGWSRRMMENRFAPGVGSPEALAWFERQQRTTRRHVAMGLGEILARTDLAADLRKLEVPIRVVLPDSSPFVPVRHGVEILEIARRARLRVVPNVRHGLPFSHAVQQALELVEFLQELEPGP